MELQPSDYFISYFQNNTLFGVLLALLFGAIWLACYWPPLKKLSLWLVLAGSAIITLLAISFIEVPVQNAIGKDMLQLMSEGNVIRSFLINGISLVIVTGLVQEGAKLVSPVIYWLSNKRTVDPKLMVSIGAAAGAGFGIFEAQYIHNLYISSGWNLSMMQNEGAVILLPILVTFFTVAFHTGTCALSSYGVARGFGWLSYPVLAIVHALWQYSYYLANAGIISPALYHVYIALFAILVMAVALWLRWKKQTSEESRKETAKA
jgi:RsiW-degrading membrane proteinase PrsW (M82 family)